MTTRKLNRPEKQSRRLDTQLQIPLSADRQTKFRSVSPGMTE
jgi:hypothetical protein